MDGIGQPEPQATEDGTAIKGIDGMPQDKPDICERREADGNKLLTEHVVGKVITRQAIVSDDTESIVKMPTDTPVGCRGRNLLQIAVPRLPDELSLVGQHPRGNTLPPCRLCNSQTEAVAPALPSVSPEAMHPQQFPSLSILRHEYRHTANRLLELRKRLMHPRCIQPLFLPRLKRLLPQRIQRLVSHVRLVAILNCYLFHSMINCCKVTKTF